MKRVTNAARIGLISLVGLLLIGGSLLVGAQETATQPSTASTHEATRDEAGRAGNETITGEGALEIDLFALVAEALGVSVEALEASLTDEVSIAQLSRETGLDPKVVVASLASAENAAVDAALAAGEITEAEAVEWRDYNQVFATEFVYLTAGEFWYDESWDDEDFEDDLGFVDSFDGLNLAIESRRGMAYSLLDQDVEPEVVIDSILDSEASFIDWFFGLFEGLFDELFYGEWDEDAYDDEAYEDELIETAAQTIGVDEDALWDALDEGGSIADVAKANGQDPQAVVDALLDMEFELIDELLKDEEISAEEAEEWRQEATEYIRELVNESWF